MKPIIFVTSNENKLREATEILDLPIEGKRLELDELQSMDLDVIIRHKLTQAWEQLKQPILVDDVGLYLNSWNGFPGPFIRFASDTMGEAELARALGDDRRCEYRVAVGYSDGTQTLITSGKIVGMYVREGRGSSGWGFDPFLLPDGHEQTYAEMGPELKHQISARGQALRALKTQLSTIV